LVSSYAYDLSNLRPTDFMNYLSSILNMVNKDLDSVLFSKLHESIGKSKVKRRLSDSNVFKLRAYLLPCDIYVISPSGLFVNVLTVSNSAITVRGDSLGIFLRLGSLNFSRTFIAYGEIPLKYLNGRLKIEAKTILPPILSSECVEDPRLDPDDYNHLYHVRAYYMSSGTLKSVVMTFHSRVTYGVNYVRINSLEPVVFEYNGAEYIIQDYRDTFPLSSKVMLVRPWIRSVGIGGIFVGFRKDFKVNFKSLRPIPELLPNPEFELKTGANASLKLSSNEYLLLFHSVERIHGIYYTYAALLSDDGELLGVTPEPIISPQPGIYSGRRPSTIFVCGAIILNDKVLVSAGKDDEVLIMMEADLNDILNKIKYVKG